MVCDHMTGMEDKDVQQLILRGRELDLNLPYQDDPSAEIHGQRSRAKDRLLDCGVEAVTYGRPDTGQQFPELFTNPKNRPKKVLWGPG